jgi:hypothetical protein
LSSLQVVPFHRELVVNAFGQQGAPRQRPAVEYLTAYLTELSAKSVLVEGHYVDRHYLDDFSSYYARSFRAPSSSCQRFHFFEELGPGELEATVQKAYSDTGALDESEALLQGKYLGFVVRRPLPGAAIGRTVLRTYPVEGRRHYEVVRPYRVNLGGFRLRIDGLAYQEQDMGAAVCASTALWSALQRVASVAGHRTPTPTAITRAANSPFPATDGLHELQMASALSGLGYVADRFAPMENRALFRAKIVSCLQSHLPVVLLIYRKMETGAGEVMAGHAVTLTGFSEPPSVVEVPATHKGLPPLQMRSGSLEVGYVHDDNLGSHAHYEFVDSDEITPEGYKSVKLRRGRQGHLVPWWNQDEWTISSALVPKPDKLRVAVSSLFSNIYAFRPLFSICFPGVPLSFGAKFALGVEYRRSLFAMGLDMSQMRAFQEGVRLPRHIGVISAFFEDRLLVDVIIDVSEVIRDPSNPIALGLVAPGVSIQSQAGMNLQQILAAVPQAPPLITGP